MSALLEVENLRTYFPLGRGLWGEGREFVRAVDGVSFELRPAEVFGIVGESGCGKSTLARTLLRLVEPTSGSIRLDGEDILSWRGPRRKRLHREMQLVFQDPYTALHPRKLVKDIVGEGLIIHGITRDQRQVRERVLEMLRRVGLNEEHLWRYPHEFSGGQRQRIALARALVLRPRIVILDEPTSALDVSVQAQILNLLVELKETLGLTYILITHDLRVVEYLCDRVAVMYLGQFVEVGRTADLYADPRHPYTRSLLDGIPRVDAPRRRERIVPEGEVPSPVNPPSGCRFRTRCPYAGARCAAEAPPLRPVGDRLVACHYPLADGVPTGRGPER